MDDRMDYTANPAEEEEILSEMTDTPEPPASYQEMTDEEVVSLCRTGDTVAV